MYLCAKDPYEAKYSLLINERESIDLKRFNDSETFIEYCNDMYDIYKNIEECNPNRKRKILIVSEYMITDLLSNKKLNLTVTELLIRGKKINTSVFITQSNFAVTKTAKPYSFLVIDATLASIILNVSERIFQKEYKN